MILEEIEKILLLERQYSPSDIKGSISCNVKFGDANPVLKVYGRCHRQLFYFANEFPIEDCDIQSKIRKMMLSSRRKSLADTIGNSDSIFDCRLNEFGINIYSSSSHTPFKAHIIETFFCLIKTFAIPDKCYIIYIDKEYKLKEFEISSVKISGDTHPVVNGIPDYSISLESINKRRKAISYYIKNNILPPIDYLQVYTETIAKLLNKLGIINKYQLSKFEIEPFGDFECLICSYKKRCKDDGNGNL